ncbi:DCL1, partial [Symbiodinium natans]
LQKCLEAFEPEMMKLESVKSSPPVSYKLLKLEALLREEPRKSGKGIVFVEQVALTVPLAMALCRGLGANIAEAMYGQMTKQDTDRTMRKLREGQIKVVVSTNALEEGIDVCDCNWVVRYDRFATTKAHIQGSGRARSQAAEIIYFENDPEEEASKAEVMAGVAKDDSLALSATERQRLQRTKQTVQGVYPFDDGQGQRIDFFNCSRIVTEWCQQVLKEEFRQEGLFPTYGGDPGARPQVRLPTPEGFEVITPEAVDTHWNGVSLQDVIDKDRLEALTKADRAKRRALFVAARFLREKQYLDDRNMANTKALELARAQCCEGPPAKKLRFTGSFDRRVEPKAGNYKGALQEFLHQLSPNSRPQDLATYKGVMEDSGWRVTLEVTTPPELATSDFFSTKKAAEQDAARRVLERLQRKQ